MNGFDCLDYQERLIGLSLDSKLRRLHGDLMQFFKIVNENMKRLILLMERIMQIIDNN